MSLWLTKGAKVVHSILLKTRGRSLVDRLLLLPHLEVLKPFIDLILILLAATWAWLVSFGQVPNPGSILPFLTVVVCARLAIYFILGLHRSSWLHVSRFEIFWLTLSALLGPPVIAILFKILPEPFTLRDLVRPQLLLTTEPAFYLLLLFGSRITARAMFFSGGPSGRGELRRILILGAGNAGRSLAFQVQECRHDYCMIGFLDDDAQKQRRRYRGVPVLGTISSLGEVVRRYEVQEIVLAITALPPERLREILTEGEQLKVTVRILPPLNQLIGSKPTFQTVREIRMEDLLPRPEVDVDNTSITSYLTHKTVLVTGGGGSIGGELCRQVVHAGAKRLIVLGRGENSVFEMMQELSELQTPCELIPAICDVREYRSLQQIFEKYHPEVVFHAAAHKHVPLMEQYPCEAVKNNVKGTLNLTQLAVEWRVENFVLVSTDKAVEPANVMGASKRLCEMIVKGYAEKSNLNMVCVRFGNVLGSRGSVVPTMARQIKRGLPVTVTDPEMVRYFMTIPEAVQLILKAGSIGGCGDVFVLDMGRPVRVLDLAHDLIRLSGLIPNQDIPIRIIGKRPGEKMYEDLLTNKEREFAEKKGPFYMANLEHIDHAVFLKQMSNLIDSGEKGDNDRVIELLHETVPDFRGAPESQRVTLLEEGPHPVIADLKLAKADVTS
jgi:FlaA1/EpsC-like NDP-sugar epimerase